MLDQSLLQSHFIGRDGFRWWIGQVPPLDSWKEQDNGGGWGNRVKVRILGYHTLDVSELPDVDLPWAQVMLPTTAGSGAANYATNPKISQGDMVIGFFLDGDNAQIPIIMGLLGRTTKWSTLGYKNPFVPFTGYTDTVKDPAPSGRLANSPGNQANSQEGNLVQPTPPQVPSEVAQRLGTPTSFTGFGRDVVFADTCENTTIKTIKSEVNNFLKTIQSIQGKLGEYRDKINSVAEVIKSSINGIVGTMIESIFNFLVGTKEKPGLIPSGLKKLYDTVFGSVFAASGNYGTAHQAGVKAQEVFVIPVQILEKAISCVANKIVEGLKNLIVQLLESVIKNVKNFVTCAADQFVASLINSVVDSIANGLSSALGGVSSLLSGVFDVAQFLLSTVDAIKGISSIFDCNQSNNKCDGSKEWKIGIGPKQNFDTSSSFDNIFNNLNAISSTIKDIPQQVGQIGESFGEIVDVFSNNPIKTALKGVNSCYYDDLKTCGPPQIKIFGGGGIGGAAAPILGRAIQRTSIYNNVTETSNIIGAIVTNAGSGYKFPPFVEIVDSCGLGYGAKASSRINEKGEITAIYITSSGAEYPYLIDKDTYGIAYGITNVVVESSGINYSNDDIAIDNQGNTYSLNIDNGSVISVTPINIVQSVDVPVINIRTETGFGAVLRPVLGPVVQDNEIKTQVDCVL